MRHQLAVLLLSPFLSFTLVKSTEGVNAGCPRPLLKPHMEAVGLHQFSPPGTEAQLICASGYTSQDGVGVIICTTRGTWSVTHLKCQPKMCPSIEPPHNGEMHFEDNVYLSTVNFTCKEGYNLHGASSVVCQENSKWSASRPECKAVTCDPAPVPENAIIVYDIPRISVENVEFGVKATYKCRTPMALIGNPRAECTIYGNWTEAPVCQMVTCPPPGPIEHGHMSSIHMKRYAYKTTIKYGCTGYYTMDEHPYVQCLATGQWSQKPACSAPCSVNIKRGRILYDGRKLWIEDLVPNKVFHNEKVSFYCKDDANDCGYAVLSQCINGTLNLPECFKEPGKMQYNLNTRNLPSEIRAC